MKINKITYFSIFFLLSFFASFTCNALQNIDTPIHKSEFFQHKHSSVSSKEESSNPNSALILEKSENETEDSLTLQVFILPFFVSYFQYQIEKSDLAFTKPLVKVKTNPIFIEVCNFRI